MKSIQTEFMERVRNGEPFNVNFKMKNMRVGNDYLIRGGDHGERKLIDDDAYPNGYEAIDLLETLFHIYKYSYPSEAETKRKKNYFKALEADMMTDEEMIAGVDRSVARAFLESFFLIVVLSGRLKWNDDWGTWYYRGKKEKGFIILREWIDG